MKYRIEQTSRFKRDYRLAKKRGYDMSLLEKAIDDLASGKPLPAKYSDHPLKGNYKGSRELHVTPDWLLIYQKEENTLILWLMETGTHSDLFG